MRSGCSKAGFLNLRPADPGDSGVGGCHVHGRVSSSIPSLYPLDARGVAPLSCDNEK